LRKFVYIGASLFVVLVGLTAAFVDWRLNVIRAGEQVVPSLELIRKQDYLEAFHVGIVEIIPIAFDFDTNRLEYDFDTTYASAADLFSVTDAAASRDGWELEARGDNSRTYSKFFQEAGRHEVEQVVVLGFKPESRRMNVVNAPRTVLPRAAPSTR
jgi:hypothetical protein